MVFRCYSIKRPGFDIEARGILSEIRDKLGIISLEDVCIYNRYDAEGINAEVYSNVKHSVFSEAQCDDVYDEQMPETIGWVLSVEALPGQYDMRADSAAQCIQVYTQTIKPEVAYAKIYVFTGDLSDNDKARIKAYLINPVDSREASDTKPLTLKREYPEPEETAILTGLLHASEPELQEILRNYSLAMDIGDLKFLRDYFKNEEKRDPTEAEIRVIDTYWSDHCRHTTFGTLLESIEIEDERVQEAYRLYLNARLEAGVEGRPVTLMDIATVGAKVLKARGLLRELDESDEVNACSIHVDADFGTHREDWLLMFKNETHNHPTEIEPYGGAATCIGGAIRDPLSGRAFVYQSMRVSGAGDPRRPVSGTLPGKLPQKQLTVTAAAGFSAYGNQIGLPTGVVREMYHDKYIAKRLETGAVVGAVPAKNVVRLQPEPGDVIILLGGRTGRDGIGGATGSSKTHDLSSLEDCAAEVQKGNAPEERKIQRLFRKAEVSSLIKRCNDFGAGGVSVAIGELADGVYIDLTRIPKKYEGLSGTELAISESQERMAVVVSPENTDMFIKYASEENLEATVVAKVTAERRMIMENAGKVIVNLSRDFLSSNGAVKRAKVRVGMLCGLKAHELCSFALPDLVCDINFSSQRGLVERFDASVLSGGVLMPFGGKYQRTPTQVMAALLPGENCETCSVMSFAFDPYLSDLDPYEAARRAVIISVAKLVAAGCDYKKAYLSFQEFFERLKDDPDRWGKPFAALLGALQSQLGLEIAAIGGKDSMSGSFMDLDVPPTLISFAIAPCEAIKVLSPEFKSSGSPVYLFKPDGDYESIKANWLTIHNLTGRGILQSAWAVDENAVIGGIFKMCVGNMIGFESRNDKLLADCTPGAVICEIANGFEPAGESELVGAELLGYTSETARIDISGESFELSELFRKWDSVLEDVFPAYNKDSRAVPTICSDKGYVQPAPEVKILTRKPLAVIPVFPGTNSEYDTALAVKRAGGDSELVVIRNLTPAMLAESVEAMESVISRAQMLIIPGGFSSGDEPEGSGKFIAAFFRNPKLKDAIHELLYKRDGLALGICNGFQALIKLGLVPFGKISGPELSWPTLTFNAIGRHQAKYVTTRIVTTASPWLSKCRIGELHSVPVSHGEGRFHASQKVLDALVKNGQIAAQYCDSEGKPSMDISVNPNGSMLSVEAIISPDGRVLGKMAHSERCGKFVARNIPGNLHQPVFEGGVDYFRL